MHPALDLTPKQRAAHREAVRLRPGDALEAIKKAIADPDDTTEVIKFSAAVTGKSVERVMRHVLALPNGKEMLEREVPLFDVRQDRDYLIGLPEGSLGRTYADWTARE
ncbi:MAG: Coq4 family protein, partial [Myxococcota bacterium]